MDISHAKFLKIEDADEQQLLVELKDLQQQFSEIAEKKKKINIYQITMDMDNREPFTNVEDTKHVL